MKLTTKHLYLLGGILVLIFAISAVYIFFIGKAYQSGISHYTENNQPSSITHNEREKITKITIQKQDDKSCIEVSPDGAVRVYKTCDKDLTNARRIADTTNITSLFKKISEIDLSLVKASTSCDSYLIAVETASSSKTICLSDIESSYSGNVVNSSGTEDNSKTVAKVIVSEIIQDIDNIIIAIPDSTPTPTLRLSQNPEVTVTAYPTPSTDTQLWLLPSGMPNPTDILKPFLCEFNSASVSGKPYRVSNVVCSSQPQPGQ